MPNETLACAPTHAPHHAIRTCTVLPVRSGSTGAPKPAMCFSSVEAAASSTWSFLAEGPMAERTARDRFGR